MKLPLLLSLHPNADQSAVLLETVERVNAATNDLSKLAWQSQLFEPSELHKVSYRDIRATYALGAQVVVLMFARVSAAYRSSSNVDRPLTFCPRSPIPYDERIATFYSDMVSLWSVDGRKRIRFTGSLDAQVLLPYQQGESWLINDQDDWCLLTQVNLERYQNDRWSMWIKEFGNAQAILAKSDEYRSY